MKKCKLYKMVTFVIVSIMITKTLEITIENYKVNEKCRKFVNKYGSTEIVDKGLYDDLRSYAINNGYKLIVQGLVYDNSDTKTIAFDKIENDTFIPGNITKLNISYNGGLFRKNEFNSIIIGDILNTNTVP